jgi:type 1 fimbriae regulatory protein FimB
MILMGFWHGLRASEVVAIRKLDLQDGTLKVRRLKGSDATVQPLIEHSDPLLNESAAVFEYVRFLSPNQKLFPVARQTFWTILQRHGETAKLPVRLRHPHILKHTIAMQVIDKAGIQNVRRYLGHKSGASTMEYLKVSDAEAAKAVIGSVKI